MNASTDAIPRIEDIRAHSLPPELAPCGRWWELSDNDARQRYAAAYPVDAPECSVHSGKWVANYVHIGCSCTRVVARGVCFACP